MRAEMVRILAFSALTSLILLLSGQTIANQYGYYAPVQYAPSPVFYRPYMPVPPPHYPVYRYRSAPAAYVQSRRQTHDAVIDRQTGIQPQTVIEEHSAGAIQKHGSGEREPSGGEVEEGHEEHERTGPKCRALVPAMHTQSDQICGSLLWSALPQKV